MRVQKVPPESETAALFPHATFADAYRVIVEEPALDAVTATYRIFGRPSAWTSFLLKWRDRIVVPLGLKAASRAFRGGDRIGTFSVYTRTPERVVLGLDDKHLDFRIVVEAGEIDAEASRVTLTTLIRSHNIFGRIYLVSVLPFHRMIVPAMLSRARRI